VSSLFFRELRRVLRDAVGRLSEENQLRAASEVEPVRRLIFDVRLSVRCDEGSDVSVSVSRRGLDFFFLLLFVLRIAELSDKLCAFAEADSDEGLEGHDDG